MNNEADFLQSSLAKSPGCLSDAALERVATGVGAEAERLHAAACPHCQTEVELLGSFLANEPTEAEAAVVRRMEQDLRKAPAWRAESAPPRRAWWQALALVGAMAVVALAVYVRNPAAVAPIDDTVRGGRIEDVAPAGDLTAIPARLEWRAVKGAVLYEVRLTDVAEQTLWQATTPVSALTLPPEATGHMAERKTMIWYIRALDANGGELAASTPERFRIQPK